MERCYCLAPRTIDGYELSKVLIADWRTLGQERSPTGPTLKGLSATASSPWMVDDEMRQTELSEDSSMRRRDPRRP